MVKKRVIADNAKRVKRPFGDGLTWVMNNISKGELDEIDGAIGSSFDVFDFILACVDAGIDIKVAWDSYSGCYTATAVGSWEGFQNSGFACSARSSSDCRDALLILWYKVAIKADGDMSKMLTEKEIDDLRG